MAEEVDADAIAALRKKRQFKKFTYRGHELEQLLEMSQDEFITVLHARARRRLSRGLNRKCQALLKRLRKAKAGWFS
jgi:small subunit ribosomal protein S15e